MCVNAFILPLSSIKQCVLRHLNATSQAHPCHIYSENKKQNKGLKWLQMGPKYTSPDAFIMYIFA